MNALPLIVFRVAGAAAALALAGSLASGCASASSAPAGDDDRQPAALLISTDGYELHLRDGQVDRVLPNRERRPVRSYSEFRELYDREGAPALPAKLPESGVEVTGYRGEDCVRQGYTCGRAPDYPPASSMVRLKLTFPQP